MRVACAPHYPAEPRALVGKEILSVLSETARAGRSGQVINDLFDTADSWKYNISRRDVTRLLALQAEIEAVIGELEAKL